jgi:transcriptional regulator with XRE-family HTH domain
MTQEQLGTRAGLVGKYVSEIERGTRDMPFSTLCALVEHGLGLRLEVVFAARGGSRPHLLVPEIDELARAVATLPADARRRALPILRSIVELLEDR